MFLQAINVALFITELQRIGCYLRLFQQFVGAVIEKVPQTVLGTNAHVVARRWHNPLVLFQIGMEDHFARNRIFDPEVFGHFTATKHRIDLRPDVICDPVHDRSCSFVDIVI